MRRLPSSLILPLLLCACGLPEPLSGRGPTSAGPAQAEAPAPSSGTGAVAPADVPPAPTAPSTDPQASGLAQVRYMGRFDFRTAKMSTWDFQTYVQFVQQLRQHAPRAGIFLGITPAAKASDRAALQAAIRAVVSRLNEAGDAAVYFFDLPAYDEQTYGLGCAFHPSPAGHRHNAALLTAEMRRRLGW